MAALKIENKLLSANLQQTLTMKCGLWLYSSTFLGLP
jgi:hypothetical protein